MGVVSPGRGRGGGRGPQAARLSAPPADVGMALGVQGRGDSGQGLASETLVMASASSSAVSSRRFLLWLYLVGFLVSGRPGAGEKPSLQTWGPGSGSWKGCAYLKFPGIYTASARSLKCAVRCLLLPFRHRPQV